MPEFFKPCSSFNLAAIIVYRANDFHFRVFCSRSNLILSFHTLIIFYHFILIISDSYEMTAVAAVRRPTEKLRDLQRHAAPGAGSLGSLQRPERGEKSDAGTRPRMFEMAGVKSSGVGSDSCYSRSDNSSTDSECPRGPRLNGRPPMRGETSLCQQLSAVNRGDTSLCQQLEDAARLERLCPRVRTQPPRQTRTYTDSTSLSSVDTSTSSSDLWNVRAMPDVPVTRLNTKPISLRANPAVRQRLSAVDSLTDDLLTRVLSYLTTRQLLGVTR